MVGLCQKAVRSTGMPNDRLCNGFDDAEIAIVARWLTAASASFTSDD